MMTLMGRRIYLMKRVALCAAVLPMRMARRHPTVDIKTGKVFSVERIRLEGSGCIIVSYFSPFYVRFHGEHSTCIKYFRLDLCLDRGHGVELGIYIICTDRLLKVP